MAGIDKWLIDFFKTPKGKKWDYVRKTSKGVIPKARRKRENRLKKVLRETDK